MAKEKKAKTGRHFKTPTELFFEALGNSIKEIGTTFVHGDWKSKLSYVIFGFGPLMRGQIAKGLAFLASEILFFVYMITFGGKYFSKFSTLGTVATQKIKRKTVYGDNSFLILLFGILAFGMASMGGSFFSLIATIMTPIRNIMTGLPGELVVVFFIMLFWWFGIHGANVMSAVTTPFLTQCYAENNAAYAAGQPLPNIICNPFHSAFFSMTGSGLTGGLIIAIFLFSKREDFKAIARLAIPCGIFNINEPIIFGIPMVMNPILALPFFLAPMASVAVGYILTAIGICPRFGVDAPWTTPAGILGFLASGGKLMGGLSQLISLAVATLIYTPFVIAANNQVQEG